MCVFIMISNMSTCCDSLLSLPFACNICTINPNLDSRMWFYKHSYCREAQMLHYYTVLQFGLRLTVNMINLIRFITE